MSGRVLLKTKGLFRSFGGVIAVNKVDLDVAEKQVTGLIGPNGAGKTTMFNLISGLFAPQQGSVVFNDRDITGLPPHKINATGISRTFQNVRIFEGMTVLENVMVGRHVQTRSGFLSALLKLPSERREEKQTRERCLEFLNQVGLVERKDELAGNLPFGLMRSLEIARALAAEPKLIMLDEPAAGLNHTETERLAELIDSMRDQGLSVILVEHDMRLVMDISDKVAVLEQGKLLAFGEPREVQNNPHVIAAYLGETIEEPEAEGA